MITIWHIARIFHNFHFTKTHFNKQSDGWLDGGRIFHFSFWMRNTHLTPKKPHTARTGEILSATCICVITKVPIRVCLNSLTHACTPVTHAYAAFSMYMKLAFD